MQIEISYLKLEAGTLGSLLSDPIPILSYITQSWITVTRDFLWQHQLRLEFATNWNVCAARKHDVYLMDILSGQFTAQDLVHLNAVWLSLGYHDIRNSQCGWYKIEKSVFYGRQCNTRMSCWQDKISVPKNIVDSSCRKKLHLPTIQCSRYKHRIYAAQDLLNWIDSPNQRWNTYHEPLLDSLILVWKDSATLHVQTQDRSQTRKAHYFQAAGQEMEFNCQAVWFQ